MAKEPVTEKVPPTSENARFCQDQGTCYISALAKNLENAMYEESGSLKNPYTKDGKRNLAIDPFDLARTFSKDRYRVEAGKDGKIKNPEKMNEQFKMLERQLEENNYQSILDGGYSLEAWESLKAQGGKIPYYENKTLFSQGPGIYADGVQSLEKKLMRSQDTYGDKEKGVIALETNQKLPAKRTQPLGQVDLSRYDYASLKVEYGKDVPLGDWADDLGGSYPNDVTATDKAMIDSLRERKNQELGKMFDQSLKDYKGGFIVGVGTSAIYEYDEKGELKHKYLDDKGEVVHDSHSLNVIGKKEIGGKTYYILDDSNPSSSEQKLASTGGQYKNSERGTTLLPADDLYKVFKLDQVRPKNFPGGLPKDYKLRAPSQSAPTAEPQKNKPSKSTTDAISR